MRERILASTSLLVIALAAGASSASSASTVGIRPIKIVYTATQPDTLHSFEAGVVALDLATGRRTWLVSEDDAGEPSLSSDGKTLAFARDGIWIANGDGSGAHPIVRERSATWPAVSPDGRYVAYTSDGLWIAKSDGSAKRRIHPRGAVSSWSPDGRRLVFDERQRIYVINADGTRAEPLTNPGSHNDDEPAWSPDGRSIVFVRDGDVYLVASGGGSPRRITRTKEWESDVSWSPDSRRLAFERAFEIYSMRIDGTSERRLTHNDIQEVAPIWAPNGDSLLFGAAPDSEIFVMRARGAKPIQLTINDASDEAVAWSPAGDRIAFASGRGGRHGVYLMRADGTGTRLLFRTASPVRRVEWSPSADRVLTETGDAVIVVDTSNGSARPLARGSYAATWSPDGQRIAYVVGVSVFVASKRGERARRLATIVGFDGSPEWAYVDWSPRGAIAFSVEGRDDVALRVVSESGKVLRDLSGSQPRWSPDGKHLAFTRGKLSVLRSSDGRVRRLNAGTYPFSPRWSSDGQSIVVRDEDGIWRVPIIRGRRVRLVRAAAVGEIDVR